MYIWKNIHGTINQRAKINGAFTNSRSKKGNNLLFFHLILIIVLTPKSFTKIINPLGIKSDDYNHKITKAITFF